MTLPDMTELTDDLGFLHVLSHNAHAVLSEFEVCKKCCKNHAQLQSESQLALYAVEYVSDSLKFSQKRLMLIPELDSFARWMCNRYSGPERRVIREALTRYHKELSDKVESNPMDPYTPEALERGIVSGCLLDLYDQ